MAVTDRGDGGGAGEVHAPELVAILDEAEAGTICTIAPAVTGSDDETMSRWLSAAGDAFVPLAAMV